MATSSAVAEAEPHGADLRLLTLGALGVVFGDIGTSPLYTLREAFGHAGGLHLSEAAVHGVLSLIFWSLIFVVTLKYVVLILRADNRGEGGVLALGTLAARAVPNRPRLRGVVLVLALIGLALFYGDGLITPAISVLSAVEGLKTAAPSLGPYVMPLSALVLLALFLFQSRGTASVGALFGPVMLVWFATLAVLGVIEIARTPSILVALDPRWAVGLFQIEGWQAFVALGAVVLAVTGAEALYADMGHFGARPIRIAWSGLVLPALVLNYFGQGALILRDPTALEHPFYHLAPEWLLWPLIGLATMATIIASQAVISGVFSLTRQAVRLGHLSRMTIEHTSATEIGQVYIPRVNWLLMIGVLAARGHLRLVEQSCRRLRHLGHRCHGDRRRPGCDRGRHPLGLGGDASCLWCSAGCWRSTSPTSRPMRSRSPPVAGCRWRSGPPSCSPWRPGAGVATCCAVAFTPTGSPSKLFSPNSTRCCTARRARPCS